MEGVGEGFKEVKDRLIEFEEPAGGEAGDGCGAEDGIDADDDAEGDGPGEFGGGGSFAELFQDGLDDPAPEFCLPWVALVFRHCGVAGGAGGAGGACGVRAGGRLKGFYPGGWYDL